MGFLTWIFVGVVAGWLAGQVMKGGGYGVVMDIVLGILGGVIGSIIVAFVGAVILVWITRMLKKP